jgi:hypothetical protein
MATKNPIKRYDAEEKGYLTSAMEKEEQEEKSGGTDFIIDVENDPLVRYIKTEQEKETILSEPTELQKKYEEMGLEYDYQKRKETGSVRANPKKQMEDTDPYKDVEDTNPDFAQRNRDFDQNINLLEQIDSQYNFKKGQLEALQLEAIANGPYSSSTEGRNMAKLLEGDVNRLTAMREAEVAKLDGQFYEGLPNRDRPVANMLLGQGIIGKMMGELTTNNGNIRDIINDTIYALPDDKKEEFRTKLLGDYVRDNQGNIVRNEVGEELRKGGDLVSLTPYRTYDYKISENVFKKEISKLAQDYGVVYDEDGKGSRGGGGGGANFKQLKDVSDFLDNQMLELEKNDPKLKELKAIKELTDNQIIEAIKGQVGVKQTPTTEATTGVAPTEATTGVAPIEATTGVAPTTEITAEENKLEEIKKSYLKSPGITELANGLLSYEDDLPEAKKQTIDEFNKEIEEDKIRKSGRGGRVGAFLEGTGIPSAGRGINRTIGSSIGRLAKDAYKYSGAELGVKAIGGAYEGAADFLSGIEESGRRQILEEEATKGRAAQGKGLFD